MNQAMISACGVDVLDAITNRRSIRKYTGEPVSEEMLRTLLNAGFCAPSAQNCRPWDFVVVRGKEKLKAFTEHCTYQKMVEFADAAIIVCGNTQRMERHDLLINDCSAAVENILLAAHGLGLGAVWCGIADDDLFSFFSAQLGLPSHIRPTALISIGHPAEERPAPDRFEPEHIHYETYGNHDSQA